MYVYIYIYVCMYRLTKDVFPVAAAMSSQNPNMHVCTKYNMHACVRTCTYIYSYVYICIYMYTYLHVYICVYMYMCIHVSTHTSVCKYICVISDE